LSPTANLATRWAGAHENVLAIKLKESDIVEMVKQTPVVFRDRLDTMLRFCEEENITFFVILSYQLLAVQMQ
jgi:hypothetical protein